MSKFDSTTLWLVSTGLVLAAVPLPSAHVAYRC